MKIILVTENNHKGGLDTFIVSLINSWPNKEDNFEIICNKSHPGLDTLAKEIGCNVNINTHDLKMPWEIKRSRQKLLRILRFPFDFVWRYFYFIKYINFFKKYFSASSGTHLIVVNGGYPGGYSCRAAAIAWGSVREKESCLFNFHNLAVKPRWFEAYFERIIDKALISSVNRFISVSKACSESLAVRKIFCNVKVDTIYNGVLRSAVSEEAKYVRKNINATEDDFIALLLGTYESRKGHTVLLDAAVYLSEVLPNFRLVFCGFGYSNDFIRLSTEIKKRGLEDVAKLIPFSDGPGNWVNACDVVVLPSIAFESFGLVLVEAMSLSRPVLGSTVGGIPEVISDGINGFLHTPGDARKLADDLYKIATDDALTKKLGENGEVTYRSKFKAERMALEYHDCLVDRSSK